MIIKLIHFLHKQYKYTRTTNTYKTEVKKPHTFPTIPIPALAAWIMLTSFPPSPKIHMKNILIDFMFSVKQ